MNQSPPEKFIPDAFHPADIRYRWHLWVRVENPDHSVGYHFFWRRIFLTLLVSTLLAWLAATGAVFAFLRYQRGFISLSYVDLVWPPRWPEHQRNLGRAYLEHARTHFTQGRPLEALAAYQAGLARVPGDLVARRDLAVLLLRFGNTPAALAVLEARLDAGVANLEYLKLACSLMFELQEDARVAALCARHLPAAPTEFVIHQFLALTLARVHFRAGNYDDAEKIIVEWRLERAVEGLLVRAACDWERGYPELALQRIQLGRDRFPTRDEIPLQLLTYYLELGRPREALGEAILRISADPESPGPRVDLLHCLHAIGDTDRYRREVEKFQREFPTDVRALELLADSAATYPDVALVEEAILAIAAAQGDPTRARVSLVIARNEAGQFAAALTLAEELQSKFPLDTPLGTRLAGWRAVAAYGTGDAVAANLFLDSYAASPRLNGPEPLLVGKQLDQLGAPDLARKIYAALVAHGPRNQAALTQLVRIDSARRNGAGLEENLPRLLDTAKPSASVLQEAYLQLDDATPARTALRHRIETFLKANPAK